MADCTSIQNNKDDACPSCHKRGKEVKIITLKSLLSPSALRRLDVDFTYYFCPSSKCNITYFNDEQQFFMTEDLKVPIFQKDTKEDTPICYCFYWTRENIREEQEKTGSSTVVQDISAHIKANRCGCEVNNPQGSCCLGNVSTFIKQI